jgi:hypothetical protein
MCFGFSRISVVKDSADMYIRTTEAVADYVGKEYGKDMHMLVKNQTERTFTEPRAPRKEESTPGLLEKYKTELDIYHKDCKEYKDNKSKVFVVILGQCLPSVRSKLESDDGYSTTPGPTPNLSSDTIEFISIINFRAPREQHLRAPLEQPLPEISESLPEPLPQPFSWRPTEKPTT